MPSCNTGGQKGRALVRQALRQASHMGLNVMRVFAHTTDPNFPLQTAPGVYNEKVFKALDFVLVEVGYSPAYTQKDVRTCGKGSKTYWRYISHTLQRQTANKYMLGPMMSCSHCMLR